MFLSGNEIPCMYLRTTGRKRNKHRKKVLLARGKLISIAKILFKFLSDDETSHEEFTQGNSKQENYYRLGKSIRIKTTKVVTSKEINRT